MTVTTTIPYFSEQELRCKGTGIIRMDPLFESELPRLREAWGKPLSPSSVCRAPSHNAKVGGHPRSLHLTENPVHKVAGTAAADITWRGWPSSDRLAFARLAWSMGWSVGLHDGFCHIDRRDAAGLPQTAYLYGAWSGAFGPGQIMNGSTEQERSR